jgi:hypothetical protein
MDRGPNLFLSLGVEQHDRGSHGSGAVTRAQHPVHTSIFHVALEPSPLIPDNRRFIGLCRRGGGQGEPGGTRAMGVCEPGQGGNAAAISNTFMCLGEPPRLSPTPAKISLRTGQQTRATFMAIRTGLRVILSPSSQSRSQ